MMNKQISVNTARKSLSLFLWICCYSLFVASPAGAAFFDTGLSARGAAMGGAYSTMYGSADLIFYNPAGLRGVSKPEISLYYHNPFSGLLNVNFNTTALAFALPVYEKGTLGLGYTQFAAGDGQDKLYQETSLTAALSYKVSQRFQTGMALKQLSHQYFPDDRTIALGDKTFDSSWRASAFTADLGMRYALTARLNAAFTYQNMIPADVGIYDSDNVPSIMRFAGDFTKGKFTLAVAQDIRGQDWGDASTTRVGTELRLSDMLDLRAGHNTDEVSVGFGLNMTVFGEDRLSFNYAYSVPSGISSVISHRLELRLRRGAAGAENGARDDKAGGAYWEGEEINLE